MRAVVVLLCYLFLTTEEGIGASERMIRACGKHLSEVIAFVCYNRYANQNDQPVADLPKETYTANDVFISVEKARSFLRITRWKRQGVVEECCLKSCSLDELKEYCEEDV